MLYDYDKVYKDFLHTGIADGSIVRKNEFDLEEEKRPVNIWRTSVKVPITFSPLFSFSS